MKIDLIAKRTYGECATAFRTYINRKYFGFSNILMSEDFQKEISHTYKLGTFYELFSFEVPDEYVHIDYEKMTIKIDKGGD